jgi:hypothetical protein
MPPEEKISIELTREQWQELLAALMYQMDRKGGYESTEIGPLVCIWDIIRTAIPPEEDKIVRPLSTPPDRTYE